MTVRQVFYQATVRGLVEKAESGYAKVQTDLTLLRRSGELPYVPNSQPSREDLGLIWPPSSLRTRRRPSKKAGCRSRPGQAGRGALG
jgi:hypothetical protein